MTSTQMKYRTFGRTGLRVSEIFLGTMGFGGEHGAQPEECRRIFAAYADAGGNVLDTANRYSEGHSERIVGQLLGADRDRFVLATKYTVTMDQSDINASGNHRKNLRHSVEHSLRRLGTDYIDLLWVHIWDADTPVEETLRALDDLVRAGKVLYVGISDTPAWVLARAQTMAELRGWSQFAGLQVPYNLLERDVERELLPAAGQLGLSVAAWSPLAQGILTGKFTRQPGSAARTRRGEISERELAVAREVDAVADELGVSSTHVAVAWIRANRPWVHPIIGARTVAQAADNLGAAGLELPASAVARLDAASPVTLGFPHDFIANTTEFVYGPLAGRMDRGR